jgi:phosphatidylglycerol:prolipoprotein diacylglycerol transferase
MLAAPDIDPVAIALGPLKIHWYGLMYVVGFAGIWWLSTGRAKRPGSGWTPAQVSDAIFYGVLGTILGGRLGYILFYNLGHYLEQPLDVFKVWQGGMSFHGGLIGVILAMAWLARKYRKPFFAVSDFFAPAVPVALGAGRIGNFINQELWGRPTDLPWGMVFRSGGELPRHPSQLYEFALEGVLLFAILWLYARAPRPLGTVSALFLICYGAFRFAVEFVREPDAHLGFILGPFTMGQLLSAPMILAGVALYLWARRRTPSA